MPFLSKTEKARLPIRHSDYDETLKNILKILNGYGSVLLLNEILKVKCTCMNMFERDCVTRWINFFEGLNRYGIFYICADSFWKFLLPCIEKLKDKDIKFWLTSMKTLTNCENPSSKNNKKSRIPTAIWLLYDLLSLKDYVILALKIKSKKP